MKYDKKIEKQVKDIKYFSDNWVGYVALMNQCTLTDRILDDLEMHCKDFLKTMELRRKEFKKMLGE